MPASWNGPLEILLHVFFSVHSPFKSPDNSNFKLGSFSENRKVINTPPTLRTLSTSDKYNFILDPHTATAVGAAKKTKDDSETLILSTAHPYKFLETIKMATSKEIKIPSQLSNTLDKKEKYDILENNLLKVKNYILEKVNES